MKDLDTLHKENDRAVELFTEVQRLGTELATCAPEDLRGTHKKFVDALIAHKRFNHDTVGVSLCEGLYSE